MLDPHNTKYISNCVSWGIFKASKLNLLLFRSLQCYSERCCSSSLLRQMSTASLSPCIVVSYTRAAIEFSDLHFKIQLEAASSRLSSSTDKVTFVTWRIRDMSHVKHFLFLVKGNSEDGMGLGQQSRVFVPIISRAESVPGLQSPSPPCPPHHRSSYAEGCCSSTFLQRWSWGLRQPFAPSLHARALETCLDSLWLQLSQGMSPSLSSLSPSLARNGCSHS